MLFDEAKHFSDQTRPRPPDASRPPGLAEILAGETSSDQCRRSRELAERPDVVMQRNAAEPGCQDGSRRWIVLTKQKRLMSGTMKTPFESTYACEESNHAVALTFRTGAPRLRPRDGELKRQLFPSYRPAGAIHFFPTSLRIPARREVYRSMWLTR